MTSRMKVLAPLLLHLLTSSDCCFPSSRESQVTELWEGRDSSILPFSPPDHPSLPPSFLHGESSPRDLLLQPCHSPKARRLAQCVPFLLISLTIYLASDSSQMWDSITRVGLSVCPQAHSWLPEQRFSSKEQESE